MALGTEPTYLSDIGHTGNILANRRVVDIPDEIMYLEEDDTPLLFLARGKNLPGGKKVKQKPTKNPEFRMLSKKPHGNWISISATTAATTGQTAAINVSPSPTMLRVGMILGVIDGEQVRVTTYDTSGNTVGLNRGFGTTTAATLATGTPMKILTPISAENSDIPEIKSVKAASAVNYCGIIRHPFGASMTAKHSELYGGDIMTDNEKEAWLEAKKEWERMLVHGEPKEDTSVDSNSRPMRVSGGVIYWIKQGDATTQTTSDFTDGIQSFVRNLFRYGSRTKVGLCSPDVIDYFEAHKGAKLEFKPNDFTYNLRVAQFETGHGTLLLARDVELENSPYGDTTAGWGGTCIGVDIEDIALRHLSGRDIKLDKGPGGRGIQNPGVDGVIYQYIGEVGFYMDNPDKHRLWTGITTY